VPDFDPDLHPRDSQGRFGEGSGGLDKWAAKKDGKSSASPGKVVGEAKAEKSTDRLFPPSETKGLPEWSKQPPPPDKIFEKAKECQELELALLNHGKGLDKDLGAKVVRGDTEDHDAFVKDIDAAMSKEGPVIVIGPLKTKERCEEKAKQWGSMEHVNDIVRATVAVDDVSQVWQVCERLKEHGMKLAEVPKNRFENPTVAGYRDLMLKVQYQNGHIGEIQVQVKAMLAVKEEGHKYYEETRSIEARIKGENRPMTSAEVKTFKEANEKMTTLYARAWEKQKKASENQRGAVAALMATRGKGTSKQERDEKFIPRPQEMAINDYMDEGPMGGYGDE
jgi:hypothetical protein